MTNYHSISSAALSANDAFKIKYPRYIKGAIIAVLVITALFIWLWPGYEAKPYQLRNPEEIIWIELPEPVDMPEPPAPLAAPILPPNIEVAPDPGVELPEPKWESDIHWKPVRTQPIDTSFYDNFVSSSALPKLMAMAKADYPEIARRLMIEGTVMVHVLVEPSGQVSQAVVIQSIHPTLDQAAVAAARNCLFTPAKQREVKVKAWIAIPFRFKLN